jgi:hypothetical protein
MSKNPNTMTADEAREWMAQGEIVEDKDGDKWRIKDAALQIFWLGKWRGEDGFDPFESYAPFAIHETRRELRQRAEAAEARVKVLNEEIYKLRLTDREYWKERAERAEVTNDEIRKHLEPKLATITAERDNLKHSLGYAEAIIKAVTEERDALLAERAQKGAAQKEAL